LSVNRGVWLGQAVESIKLSRESYNFYVCTKAPEPAGRTSPMPPKAQKAAVAGRLIGYARVSTEDQGPSLRLQGTCGGG